MGPPKRAFPLFLGVLGRSAPPTCPCAPQATGRGALRSLQNVSFGPALPERRFRVDRGRSNFSDILCVPARPFGWGARLPACLPASHRLYGGNRAKGPFGQNRVKLADPEVGLEGCGGDLEAESGLFGPNWPGVGPTCRGGWGPIFGSWGLTMKIGPKSTRAKI